MFDQATSFQFWLCNAPGSAAGAMSGSSGSLQVGEICAPWALNKRRLVTIAEQVKQLSEKDSTIAEQVTSIAAQVTTIADQANELSAQTTTIAGQATELSEKNATITEQAATIDALALQAEHASKDNTNASDVLVPALAGLAGASFCAAMVLAFKLSRRRASSSSSKERKACVPEIIMHHGFGGHLKPFL